MNEELFWRHLIKAAFITYGLPEVEEEELEPGTYTNAQIAEHFRDNLLGLFELLERLPEKASAAEKRSILSFTVEAMEKEKE